MIGLSRLKRAIEDVPTGGMQTGDPKVRLKLCDAQLLEVEFNTIISERDNALAQNAELVASNLEQLNNCLAALQIANKRIDKLEKYNLDLANESHNKSNMIDYERSKNADAARAGFVAGYHKMHIEFVGSLSPSGSAESAADQYAEKVRRGEV